ncbi:MAG: DUF4388 domain-containing protein [Alphaproteobacteria bacterium]|nr:DUF4388 domain-containing protein [Alphaproteobacteria bacterium]
MREVVLEAELEAVHLASLVQLVEGEMFDGWLHCPTGRLGLRQGAVVAARCGELDGMPALRELFLCPVGRVRLERGVAEGAPLGGTLALVMEGVRIADEWDRLAPLVLDEAAGFEAPTIGPVDRALLNGFDGVRTTYEVVKAAGIRPSGVTDALLQLMDEGWLVEVAPARPDEVRRWQATVGTEPVEAPAPAPVAAAPEPEPEPMAPAPTAVEPQDYYEALDAGRIALRAGDHDAAEASFMAALAARPGDRIAAQNLKRVRALQASA